MSHYKPYEAYKPSGLEWFGDIPKYWNLLSLHHVARLKSGSSVTALQFSEDGKYPVYGGNGLRGKHENYTHKGNFVLIGRQGALCGNINIARGKFFATEHAIVVSPDKMLNTNWMGYQLKSMNLNQYSVSAAQPGLSAEVLGRLKILFPPMEDQEAIAHFLDYKTAQIDALIAKKQTLLSKLAEQRTALISQTVSKGLDPTVPMKDSGVAWLDEIPAHWSVPLLGYVAEVRGGVTKGRKLPDEDTFELPYLRVANVQDGYIDLNHVANIEILTSELPRYSLQKGDVLMNEGGDNDKLGRGAVWNGEIEPCLHQNHVFAVRPRIREFSNWLALLTQSSYAKFYFFTTAKQSTNLASISSSNIKKLPVLLPPEGERRAIIDSVARSLGLIEKQREKALAVIDKLHEYRAALITNAVTGKIDVRNFCPSHVIEPKELAYG